MPAVNSHYKAWRKRLLQAGLELHELRHDAALQSVLADTAPNQGEFVGLHVKAAVVDRDRVFIGSMNLDLRSENINSEMSVVIESTSLGAELAEVMERDMGPENAWRVRLNPAGDIRWEALDKVLIRQPARSFWQRIEVIVVMAFPRDLY